MAKKRVKKASRKIREAKKFRHSSKIRKSTGAVKHGRKKYMMKKTGRNRVKTKYRKVGKVFKKSGREERVLTRIKNLDRLIGGGFEKDSTNLLVGGSGSGKSIFATQFLVEAMNKGEKCLYVTFEEKKEQFYENMLSLGWNLADYEKKGLFTFLEYTPIKVKTMLEEGGGIIESIILKKKISRMAIDSITSFALLFEDELAKREAALALFNMIRDWECTSLLTLEEDPSEHKDSTSRAIEFEVDSTIAIYFIRRGNKRERFIEVLKMRGSDHSKKIYPMEIRKGGVFIKNKPVSKISK